MSCLADDVPVIAVMAPEDEIPANVDVITLNMYLPMYVPSGGQS